MNNNAQATGEREVHRSNCSRVPNIRSKIYLGMFNTCKEALEEARKRYRNVDGCFYCIPQCNHR